MSSWRLVVNWEGKKPGKYFWMKLKTSTWPTGVMGAIRMMAKGMKVRTSRAVRRMACTSLPFSDAPANIADVPIVRVCADSVFERSV